MILSIGLAIGLLGGSVLALNQKQSVKAAKADDPLPATTKYIPFAGNFTFTKDNGSQDNYGNVSAPVDARFWDDRYFNALDTFYRGEENGEGWFGTIQSREWIQKGNPYVSFTLGGNPYEEVEGQPVVKTYVQFYYIDGENVHHEIGNPVVNEEFNDPRLCNNMIVKYFKVPDSHSSQLASGMKMYLKIVDGKSGGHGYVNFGYLCVNQSKTDVATTISLHKQRLHTDNSDDPAHSNKLAREHTLSVYAKSEYSEFVGANNTGFVEDFEDNYPFTSRWLFDEGYKNVGDSELHFDKAISSATNHWNNNDLPFNQTGNKFFKGYYENDTGFIGGDWQRYRFLSPAFRLSGSGFVSVKMAGGSASFHVLNGDYTSANYGQELAYIDVKTYQKTGTISNVAIDGFNTCTLVRHVINLSPFLGQDIMIGLADWGEDTNIGWCATNFDEIVTYYPTSSLGFKVDSATQNSTIHPHYFDKYVSCIGTGHEHGDIIYTGAAIEQGYDRTEDNSDMKAAYNFLHNQYYNIFRANGEYKYDNCGYTLSQVQTLAYEYGQLSKTVQAIVDNSQDITRDSQDSGEWYQKSVVTDLHVGYVIQQMASKYGVSIDIKNPVNDYQTQVLENSNSIVVILVIGVSLTLVLGAAFLFFKKKKQER